MTLQLIVGLGNPGPDYQHTRHNAGIWFIEALIRLYHASLSYDKKYPGHVAKLQTGPVRRTAFIPACFMNISGRPVQAIMHYFAISPDQVLVVHDDLDLPVGTCRLREGGGSGGHNGIKDIVQHLGTPHFYRLKIGIGRPKAHQAVHDYVLSPPAKQELLYIHEALQRSLDVLPLLWDNDWSRAQQQLHTDVTTLLKEG